MASKAYSEAWGEQDGGRSHRCVRPGASITSSGNVAMQSRLGRVDVIVAFEHAREL